MRDRAHWIILPTFRPERDPLTGLAKALAERAGRLDGWRGFRDRLAGEAPGQLFREVADDLRIKEAAGATLLSRSTSSRRRSRQRSRQSGRASWLHSRL